MRSWLVGLAVCGAAACGASLAPPPAASPDRAARDPRGTEQPAGDAGEASPRGVEPLVASLRCVEGPLPERLRVRFAPGHTARDLAVWYATTTCTPVASTRPGLARTSMVQVDALVHSDALLALFDSLLRSVGLRADDRGDQIAIVEAGATAELEGRGAVLLEPADDAAEDDSASP